MKSRRIQVLAWSGLLAIALGFAVACGDNGDTDDTPTATQEPTSTAAPPAGDAPAEVQLTDADNGSTVQLANGGTLIVALPSNPSTGFSWSVSEQSSAQLVLQGEPAFVPGGSTAPVPGAGGTQVFTFKAESSGTAELTLEYRRDLEPGEAPEDAFDVTVEIR